MGATSVGSYTVKATPNQGCEKTSVAATLTQRDTNGLLVIAGEATQVKCTGQTLSLTASLTDASLTGTYNGIRTEQKYLVPIPLPIL